MRKDMNIFDFLAQIPWWVSTTLSASFYLVLKFVVPYFESQGHMVNEVHVSLGPVFAPVVALAMLSPVTFSLIKSNRRKKLYDLKGEIQSIQDLSWHEFKELVAEAYKIKGYVILDENSFTVDPKVDLVMRKGAKLYLLQCRYWQNKKLSVREVKNLFSLMQEKHASGIFLLTTGVFTSKARHYAISRPIDLVDGIELVKLLDKARNSSALKTIH